MRTRITMEIYLQTITEERRAAQDLAFGNMMGTDADISAESSDRTHANPARLDSNQLAQKAHKSTYFEASEP
jgi:hypothetical protein